MELTGIAKKESTYKRLPQKEKWMEKKETKGNISADKRFLKRKNPEAVRSTKLKEITFIKIVSSKPVHTERFIT